MQDLASSNTADSSVYKHNSAFVTVNILKNESPLSNILVLFVSPRFVSP